VDRNSRDDGASEAAGDFGVTVVQFQINPQTALPIDVSSGRQLGGEIYRVIIAAIFLFFAAQALWNFKRRKIRQLAALRCFDSLHRWRYPKPIDDRNVSSKVRHQRVSKAFSALNFALRNMCKNNDLGGFWLATRVHICNTFQKKDPGQVSHDKFKLPFGP
jgi:hypothetical protein